MNQKLIKKLPILGLLLFSIIFILTAIYLLSPKKPKLPEIFTADGDNLEGTVKIKAGLEGLPPDAEVKKAAVIRSANGWSGTAILSAAGEGILDITGLESQQELSIHTHPYLIKTITGIDPSTVEEIFFPNLITGDLNQDGAINVVDWSWISKNYQAE